MQPRFYVVSRDHLGEYGDSNGSLDLQWSLDTYYELLRNGDDAVFLVAIEPDVRMVLNESATKLFERMQKED